MECGFPEFALTNRCLNAIGFISILFVACICGNIDSIAQESYLQTQGQSAKSDSSLVVTLSENDFQAMRGEGRDLKLSFPLPGEDDVVLELQRFYVLASDARFLVAGPAGEEPLEIPEVILYRGKIVNEPASRVFLAFTEQRSANGYIVRGNGRKYFLSHTVSQIKSGQWGRFTVAHERPVSGSLFDEDIVFCATEDGLSPGFGTAPADKDIGILTAGPRIAHLAIDGDEWYVNDLFGGDLTAASAYAVQLVGVASDIYRRDLHMKLMLAQLRLWKHACPMDAADLASLEEFWVNFHNPSAFNLIELFSGRRDLWYYGRAVVTGGCQGQGAYGIQGYLNGSFYSPYNIPNIGNGDIFCVTHEWGHNFGAPHTHDGVAFDPRIDSCDRGHYSRGSIMSYCHLFPGEKANIDFYFHSRIRERLLSQFGVDDCFAYDCNDNNIPDSADIAGGASFDTNMNGIPDDCEDCDNNGVLDDIDIAEGGQDINDNGVPDICEADCNGNGVPDEYDLSFASEDLNGNGIPDECEPDCNQNGLSDLVEVREGIADDVDRNAVPDVCQDCNTNGVTDWMDMGRQYNIFISDADEGVIREFHWASGVQVATISHPLIQIPRQIIFGPDRQLYVCDHGEDCILRVNVDFAEAVYFVAPGSGGPALPSDMVFAPDGQLLVSSFAAGSIMEYDGISGEYIGDFVESGSGGLSAPTDLAWGPDGDLYVATGDNRILIFSGIDGSFLSEFVNSPGAELQFGQGMLFTPAGNLVIASINNNLVPEFDGTDGSFVRLFPGVRQFHGLRNMCLAYNGNVLILDAARTLHLQEYEYEPDGGGRIFVNRIRLQEYTFMEGAWGLAVRPPSPTDCNSNSIPDECDIATGILNDSNSNGYPDECEGLDFDNDGYLDFQDNCILVFNPTQSDTDGDNVGDACDRCPGYSDLADNDHDLVPDECDNCPERINPYQSDADGDLIGDSCDNCISVPTGDQTDSDGDGFGDVCDICPGFDDALDADGDNIPDGCDRCPGYDDSFDADGDSVPDSCDECPGYDDYADYDDDTVPDSCDNCPMAANPDQIDTDGDGLGDVCDIYQCGDANGDEVINVGDAVSVVNYIFKGGPAPDPLEAGDANCDGDLNIADGVYIINHVFKGGPEPCCP